MQSISSGSAEPTAHAIASRTIRSCKRSRSRAGTALSRRRRQCACREQHHRGRHHGAGQTPPTTFVAACDTREADATQRVFSVRMAGTA